jgi:hypothetical protein
VTEDKVEKGNDNNFKVLVRVRPPLPREMPANFERGGHLLDFSPVAAITEDHKACILQEYLGAEITEKGR